MSLAHEPLFLGLEIGGSKLQLVAAASPTRIVSRQRLTADRAGGGAAIREQIQMALRQWNGTQWQAGGVGFGGPVNWRSGEIRCSNQVDGWANVNFRKWLEDLIEAPVAVENDASVAALAESRHGAGDGFNPVFYTNSGSGVGGGLIVNGQIYHGAEPGQAEFGHLRLAPNGPVVEDHCSGWAVDRKVRDRCEKHPASDLARLAGTNRGCEARHLAKALAEGDPAARQILEGTAGELAFALSHVIHLFNPGVVVLGGGLALLGEPWRSAVAQAIPGNLMGAFRPGPAVRLAALGEDVVPVGALALAESLTQTESEMRDGAAKNGEPGSEEWIGAYISKQRQTLSTLPVRAIAQLTKVIRIAGENGRNIFVIGNGGNAANASHFATDLGKGASDVFARRFRILSLADNAAWMTALGNDYAFEDVFVRQLMNFAHPGDVLIASSVSGSSPNLVNAVDWASAYGLETIALVGARRGRLAEVAKRVLVIDDTHYGRVEDAQMTILHMFAYAFMDTNAVIENKPSTTQKL